jgi:hypothetical protein
MSFIDVVASYVTIVKLSHHWIWNRNIGKNHIDALL